MQTFLPWPSFSESAITLDTSRLGKQRVESRQILRTLTYRSDGWRYHPAVKMWIGYEYALVAYGLEVCRVWQERGYEDTVAESLLDLAVDDRLVPGERPWWLGDLDFHESHRANLERKIPGTFAGVDPTLPYLWPCNICEKLYPASSCRKHRGDLRKNRLPAYPV